MQDGTTGERYLLPYIYTSIVVPVVVVWGVEFGCRIEV